MWGIFKNLSCLVSILKRIAQKLKSSFKRRTKSMIESHSKENSIVSEEQLDPGKKTPWKLEEMLAVL